MAYGQKNYSDIQGINGKFRISQIGCFLTSFSNLLERFGRGAAPNHLNAVFRDRGIFIDVDDGIRDDLGWQSIVAYDGRIALQQSGSSAVPPHRNSIVRIAAGNSWGTHFCLVDRIEGSTVYVVDSWDGVVKKSSVYGPITGWAAYGDMKPQPVTPQGGSEVANESQVKTIYRAVLHREGDPGGVKNYTGRDANTIISEMLGSQERKNLDAHYSGLQAKVNEMQVLINSLSSRPSKEEYARVQAQINDKVAEIQKLSVALEAEKKNVKTVLVHDEETKQNVTKTLTLITAIFNYFAGQFKTFQKYNPFKK